MHFKKEGGGLPQADRLSKLVCEGRRESHRQYVGVRGGWGLAERKFERGTPSRLHCNFNGALVEGG